jgi:hypothetical protein
MRDTEQSAPPKSVTIDTVQDVRPDAANVIASIKRNFKPATLEEQVFFRKWIRGALIFYSAIALVLGGLAIANHHPIAASNSATPRTPYSVVSSTNLRQHAP